MKRIDLVEFNKELFQKLQQAGVKLEDFKYCQLYRDYHEMLAEGTKRTAVAAIIGERYHLSVRQVYNIVKNLETPIKSEH